MKFRIIDLEGKDKEKLLVCDFFGELGGTENGGTANTVRRVNQFYSYIATFIMEDGLWLELSDSHSLRSHFLIF